MVLVCGLPGSGKSFFAERLAARLDGVWIRSDALRTELGLRGDYRRESLDRVYGAMMDRARRAAREGRTPLLDATFSSRRYRALAAATAAELGRPLVTIRVRADETTTLERLHRRREQHDGTSQAGPDIYRLLHDRFDPIEGPHLTLDSSDEDLDAMLAGALAYLNPSAGETG